MKNLKHTQGEWEISYSSTHTREQVFHVSMSETPTFEEEKANSKLIVSAPELLSVSIELKGMLDKMDSIPDYTLFVKLINTIKKATT